jgi:thymidine kinase
MTERRTRRIPLKAALRVHAGTMFAGKTKALLGDLTRYQLAGWKTSLFKPMLDNRYSENSVRTHDGDSMEAVPLKSIKDIYDHIDETVDVIGIDEAQFFQTEELLRVVDELMFSLETPIVVAGLDMDYMGRPFGAIPFLLAKADYAMKYKAVCVECGDDSIFEFRKDDGDSNLIKLGGKDEYDSLCRSCRRERILRGFAGETDIRLSGSDR